MVTTKLYKQLEKAVERFKETSDYPDDMPHRESIIQRFEYTFEIAWKLMAKILKENNIKVYGTKNVIREAGRFGLLENEEIVEKWLIFANARNKSSHIYNDEIAKEVESTAKDGFLILTQDLLNKSAQYV